MLFLINQLRIKLNIIPGLFLIIQPLWLITLAREVGSNSMQEDLDKFDYGNRNQGEMSRNVGFMASCEFVRMSRSGFLNGCITKKLLFPENLRRL